MRNRGYGYEIRSDFLEADNIDGLHIVFPGGDLVEDVVGGYLVVLDDTAHLQFEYFSDDWDLLGVGVPHQTVHLHLILDLLPKAVQVEFLLVDLHVEDHDRLGDGLGFLLLLGFLGFGFGGGSWFIIGEGVKVVVFFLLLLLFFLLLVSFLVFLGFEGLAGLLGEIFAANDGVGGDKGEVPGDHVGVGLSIIISKAAEDNCNS